MANKVFNLISNMGNTNQDHILHPFGENWGVRWQQMMERRDGLNSIS